MITIPVHLSDELAQRVMPLQDRLPEIIELGLQQIEAGEEQETGYPQAKQQVLSAMASTGIVTLPAARRRPPRLRHTPIKAGGRPASELMIAERRGES